MDSAYKNPTRKFPAYTTAELENMVAMYEDNSHPLCEGMSQNEIARRVALLKAEVANRKSGASKPFVVPQL